MVSGCSIHCTTLKRKIAPIWLKIKNKIKISLENQFFFLNSKLPSPKQVGWCTKKAEMPEKYFQITY